LQLQTAVSLIARPEVATRINASVDDLDATIRDIRRAIFELRTPLAAALRTELREAVDAAAEALGFRPALDTFGPVDSAVPDAVRPELLAVLREALSNVVRHAGAASVRVAVHVADGRLTLTVLDDGVGVEPTQARSGMVNMCRRAEALGGTCEIGRAPGSGTLVSWSVPLVD
ncbi:MAG TPA: ATP-binding protein, partial [Pilimelia sp.]|nr:ATP-binding protein [Pilimelia sp.]